MKKALFFVLPVFAVLICSGCTNTMINPAQGSDNHTCTESWECTAWTDCVNSQQTRSCTDSNECGTTSQKPAAIQSCEVKIIDCGMSDTLPNFSLSSKQEPDFEKDQALVCFGRSVKNCANAVMTIENINETDLFEVSGTGNANCMARITVQRSLKYPSYEDKYLECPVSNLTSFIMQQTNMTSQLISQKPGSFGATLYIYMAFIAMIPQNTLGCTGDLIEAVQEFLKK